MSTIRSPEVSKCAVCGARTNLIHVGHTPSVRGVTGRMVWGDHREQTTCPNAESCWHHELEAKLQWLRFPHPVSVRRALMREVAKIRKDNAVAHDIADIDAATPVTRRVDITFTRRSEALAFRNGCQHHRDRDGQIIEAIDVPVKPPIR